MFILLFFSLFALYQGPNGPLPWVIRLTGGRDTSIIRGNVGMIFTRVERMASWE